jgi:hypothetical protein
VRKTRHIDEMYAFVQTDPADQTEGVIGFLAPDGTWMPMVGADTERIEYLRPMAQQIATATDREVRVIRFTVREEIEVIKP